MNVRVRNVAGISIMLVVSLLVLAVASFSCYGHLTKQEHYMGYTAPGVAYLIGFTVLAIMLILTATMQVVSDLYLLTGSLMGVISASIAIMAIIERPPKWMEFSTAVFMELIALIFVFVPQTSFIAKYLLPYRVISINKSEV